MVYSLRKANINDFDVVYSIKKNALGKYIEQTWGWDEDLQLKMQNEEFKTENISLIKVDGKPIGTLGLCEKDGIIIISRLYIIDNYQLKGIGSKIVTDIIEENPNKAIRLGVLKVNHRAIELYKRLGFEVYCEENQHLKMVLNKKRCLNCGTEVEQNFCPNCGQKTSFQRYTIKQILNDFFHTLTHVDSGILFLIKEQFFRPGMVVNEYIKGKRKKYFNPFQYMILGVAVVTFFTVNLDLGLSLFGNLTITGENAEIIKQNFTSFFYKYINIILMLTVPLIAFYSRIFFRKSGFNYAEHLVLNTFTSAQRHLFFLITVPFLYFFRHHSEIIMRIFASTWGIYFIWTYIQFFKTKKIVWGIIKAFIVGFLFLLSNGIIVGLFYFLLFKK